jgi:hypothetical protein
LALVVLIAMGFPRARHVMAHFIWMERMELARMRINHYPRYRAASVIVHFRHRLIPCRTGALVAAVMGLPRTQRVMAHFAGVEKAGVFLSHHPLRAGAIVGQQGNRFIFCGARIYLWTKNEGCTMETGRHDHHPRGQLTIVDCE